MQPAWKGSESASYLRSLQPPVGCSATDGVSFCNLRSGVAWAWSTNEKAANNAMGAVGEPNLSSCRAPFLAPWKLPNFQIVLVIGSWIGTNLVTLTYRGTGNEMTE
jgi:hypothetical protein